MTGFVGASAGEEQRVPAGQSWSFCNLISDTTSITSVTSSALEVSREVRPTLKGLTGRRDPQGCLRGRLIRKAGGEPTSSGDTQPHGVLIVTADVLRAPAPMQVPAHPSLFIVLPTERRGSRIETHFQGICGPHREGIGLRVTPSFLAWAAVSSDET